MNTKKKNCSCCEEKRIRLGLITSWPPLAREEDQSGRCQFHWSFYFIWQMKLQSGFCSSVWWFWCYLPPGLTEETAMSYFPSVWKSSASYSLEAQTFGLWLAQQSTAYNGCPSNISAVPWIGRLQLGRGKWPTRKEPIANLESYQICQVRKLAIL